MNFKLSKIDELSIDDHYYIDADDVCYYLGEYTARKGSAYSETNRLIINLKKSVERAGLPDYRYKLSAIESVARYLSKIGNVGDFTIVPVPPSKSKADALYDDRLNKILIKACELNNSVNWRELVIQNNSYQASHDMVGKRPSPDELIGRYTIDRSLLAGIKNKIIVFDDVLTAGSHFKALKRFIVENTNIDDVRGLFIARTTRDSDIF